eukprot:642231-Rhodomonas_salina.4
MRGSKIHPLCSSLPPTEATGTRDDDHGMQRVQQSSGKRRWRVLKSFDEQLCSPHFNRARCCGQVCGFRSVSDAVWRRMSTSLALHRARLAASWCGASQLCSRFMRTNVKSSLLPEGGLLAVSAYITTLVQARHDLLRLAVVAAGAKCRMPPMSTLCSSGGQAEDLAASTASREASWLEPGGSAMHALRKRGATALWAASRAAGAPTPPPMSSQSEAMQSRWPPEFREAL